MAKQTTIDAMENIAEIEGLDLDSVVVKEEYCIDVKEEPLTVPEKIRKRIRKSVIGHIKKKKMPDYTPEKLCQALQAIKNGTPVTKAALQYQIPRTTLRNKISGQSPVEICERRGYYSALGRRIEDEIEKWMVDTVNRGFPVTMEGVLTTVRMINENRKLPEKFLMNITPSKMWYYAFLRRHPEASHKHAEYVAKDQGNVTDEKIRRWFRDVLEQLGENGESLVHPERIWNMGESVFNIAPTGELVLAPAKRLTYIESKCSEKKEHVTTLFSVNANGMFAPPLTLYKYMRLPATASNSAPSHWRIAKTDNGRMTSTSFYEYIEDTFLPFLEEKKIQKPVIIFLDGHFSHQTLHLGKFCRENGIVLVALYPNATHILQPLDVTVFKALKSHWKALKRLWRIDNDGHEMTKFDLPRVLNLLIHEDQMKSNIVLGFNSTGLFPFNEHAVDYSEIDEETTPQGMPVMPVLPLPESQEFKKVFLESLENKIDPEILANFKATLQSGDQWSGAVSHTSLFYMWTDSFLEVYPSLPAVIKVEVPDSPTEEVHNSDESSFETQDPDPLKLETSDSDSQEL